MNIEMLLFMETEDDDEPMTDEQWDGELNEILIEVVNYIKKRHKTYVKNIDGEFATEKEGCFKFKKNAINVKYIE